MNQEESELKLEQLKKESKGFTKLSILIPAIPKRRALLNMLYMELSRQIDMSGFKTDKCGKVEKWNYEVARTIDGIQQYAEDLSPIIDMFSNSFTHPKKIEIVFNSTDKTIGEKRNELLQSANGEYVCFFDDDDFPSPEYIKLIMQGVESNPDCVSLKGIMTTDGLNPEMFEHSLEYSEWKTTNNDIKYERYPNHLNVIRASIAKQFQFPQTNFGEDHAWSTALHKSGLLKTEVYIDKVLYYYQYRTKK